MYALSKYAKITILPFLGSKSAKYVKTLQTYIFSKKFSE